MNEIPPIGWVTLGVLLLSQGIWVYRDAEKRGERKWLWGFFALLNVPSNLIIYLLVTRYVLKRKTCLSCGHKAGKKANFCPNCGKKF